MPTRFRSVVERAEAFMRLAHAGQKRKGGQPYATHPAAVRDILVAEFGVSDEDVLVAALLHDVAEDTRVPLSEIGERFGSRVEGMVRVLSKIPEADEPRAAMLVRYYEGLRAADPAVRQIKIADRIHNLRELGETTPAFRAQYLAETDELATMLSGTPGVEFLLAQHMRSRNLFGDVIE